MSLIESMIALQPKQGNLRQVSRLFSFVRALLAVVCDCGIPWTFLLLFVCLTHHPFLYIATTRNVVAVFSDQEYKNAKCKTATSQSDWKKIEPLSLPTL